MNMKRQHMTIQGTLILVARDKAGGKVIGYRKVSNMIPDVGLAWVAGALQGGVGTPSDMKYIAIGTGTNAAAAGDTALQTEVETRGAGTQTLITTDTTDDTYQCVATITMTGSRALTEAGLLSAAAAGTLGARQVFSVINLVSGNTLEVTWKWDMDRP